MKIQNYFNFAEVYKSIKDTNMSIRTAYKFSRLAKFADEQVDFYRTNLNKILDKYALKDDEGKFIPTDDGNGIKVYPEHIEACNNELNELANVEVDGCNITFNLSELEAINTTPNELSALLPFIEEN